METFLNMSDGAQANELTEEQKLAEVKRFFEHYNAVSRYGTVNDDYFDDQNEKYSVEGTDKPEKDYSGYNYFLKEFYGLLSDEDILQNLNKKDNSWMFMKEEFIDYDTILQPTDKERYAYEYLEDCGYYAEGQILMIYQYPYYSAYKLGETIEDCVFIGASGYTNDFAKMIDYYLETGETDVMM